MDRPKDTTSTRRCQAFRQKKPHRYFSEKTEKIFHCFIRFNLIPQKAEMRQEYA